MDTKLEVIGARPRRQKPLRAMPRSRTRPWQLRGRIEPAATVTSGSELYAQCGERLARLLLELATWDRAPEGCAVSDRTFLIVSFSPAPQVGPYVQFLSAPTQATVLWEVASLDYMPNLDGLLSHAKHGDLTRRGFVKGRKSPSNYAREVGIDDLDAARRVACETLAILVDIFDYRGLEPLTLFYVGERQARSELVYRNLRPDELTLLLCRSGIGATPDTTGIRLTYPTDNDMRLAPGREGDLGAFTEYKATARFGPHLRLTDRLAHEWNAGSALSRLHLKATGEGTLSLPLPLRYGMSESQIVGIVGTFIAEVGTLAAALGGAR